jgi:ubiquinone/menaquinone biosynthesis C-methylase UbiE
MTDREQEKKTHEKLEALTSETARVTRRWAHTTYYDVVEGRARKQWDSLIAPFLGAAPVDYDCTLELAVGHGRMTDILLGKSGKTYGVDVLQENIDFCQERFGDRPDLVLLKNNGVRLEGIENDSVTFVFCFDSMVHFDSDVIRNYLGEFCRVMKSGGFAFLHHSNLTRNPGGDFQRNAHARNFMSLELFKHYATKEGLKVVKQKVIDWGEGEKRFKALDGLTLLQKQ